MTRADYFDAALARPVPDGRLAANTCTHFLTAGLSASEFDPELEVHLLRRMARGRRVLLLADVFNVFDSQDVISYDHYTEIAPQIANPTSTA